MKVRNHVIGTAIRKIKFRIGAKSRNTNHNPDKNAANAPQTTVARLLYK